MTSDPHIVRTLPSLILYNNCDNDTFDDVTMRSSSSAKQRSDTPDLDEFCRRVLEKGEYPRLQVVERNRCLYTINNTRLALFQRLEQSGYCRKVRVEVVPIKALPPGLRDVLCPQTGLASLLSYWGKLCRGYKPVDQSGQAGTDNNNKNDDKDDDGNKCIATDDDNVDENANDEDTTCYRHFQSRHEVAESDDSSDEDYDDDDDDEDEDDSSIDSDESDENEERNGCDDLQGQMHRLETSGLMEGQGHDT